jgi:hypothetical protein
MTPTGAASAASSIPTGAPILSAPLSAVPSGDSPPQGAPQPQFQNAPAIPPDAAGRRVHALLEKKYGVREANPDKAAKFVREAKTAIRGKNPKKAFELYQQAFQLDEKNDLVLQELVRLSMNLGDPLSSYQFTSVFIERHPNNAGAREHRLKMGAIIQRAVKTDFNKMSSEEQGMAQQAMLMTVIDGKMDRGVLLAKKSTQEIEGLKEREVELKTFHPKSTEEKKAIIGRIGAQIQEMREAMALPYSNPAQAQLVRQEISKIIAGGFGMLVRFAAEDSDAEIKKLAPLFQAYQFLAEGKPEEALRPFQIVRSDGFKELGKGDEAKGEESLKKTFAEVEKLVQENRTQEAQERLAGLPHGLGDAYGFLSMAEPKYLRRLNMGVLELWEQNTEDNWRAEREEANQGWGLVSGVAGGILRLVWDQKTEFDDINEKSDHERDLIAEVRKRIENGHVNTVLEALTQIKDEADYPEPDKFPSDEEEEKFEKKADAQECRKERAEEILEAVKAEKLGDPLVAAILYSSQIVPEKKAEDLLVSTADQALKAPRPLETGARIYAAAGINAILQFHSRDPKVRENALKVVDRNKLGVLLEPLLPGAKQPEVPKPQPQPQGQTVVAQKPAEKQAQN